MLVCMIHRSEMCIDFERLPSIDGAIENDEEGLGRPDLSRQDVPAFSPGSQQCTRDGHCLVLPC